MMHIKERRLAIGVAAVCFVIAAPACTWASEWRLETVESGICVQDVSLGLDGTGTPHVACTDHQLYQNERLWYAVRTGSPWDTEIVPVGRVGRICSLAVDHSDRPCIAHHGYTPSVFACTSWDGTAWNASEVTSYSNATHGGRTLALDDNDTPSVIYTWGDFLYYVKEGAGSWNRKLIHSDTTKGQKSLALASDGTPHVAFYSGGTSNNYLLHAVKTDTGWDMSLVDGFLMGGISLALDDNDVPHISYYVDGGLKYAVQDGTSWNTELVDTFTEDYGADTGLALDAEGNPHISYFFYEQWVGDERHLEDLKYARWDGSAWATETVDNGYMAGVYNDIAVDETGGVHIAYSLGMDNGSVMYATIPEPGTLTLIGCGLAAAVGLRRRRRAGKRRHSGSIVRPLRRCFLIVIGLVLGSMGGERSAQATDWLIETVDEGPSYSRVGEWCAIAVDSQAQPHISYHQPNQDNLRYARRDGTGWDTEIVDTNYYTGEYTSIAVDSNDHPHISYYAVSWWRDPDNSATALARKLRYASWNGSDWNTQTLDETSRNSGEWTSIAIDSSDYPRISHDRAGGLGYAKWDGTAWEYVSIALAGQYTSLALDSSDRPHISFGQTAYGYDVKYTTLDNGSWQTGTILASGEPGPTTSIALDDNDVPHVVFYRWRADELVYAVKNGATWSMETIDSIGVGRWCSLALDDNNAPHVSYYNEALGDLMYATRNGSSWSIETVDLLSNVGQYSSIAVDDWGNVHIAYYDSPNGDLKYATTAIPEPGTLTLVTAAAGLAGLARKRGQAWRRRT